MHHPGLYVVATPIGNLQDITLRALETLQTVDLVLAEDTRHTRRLFQAHKITAHLEAVHEHNEEKVVPALLQRLEQGQSIALVSDAGTPLISDPGYRLVSAAAGAGHPVWTVPGASAVTAALSVSGLPTDRFSFEGFLSARPAARRKQLDALRHESRTLVLYESSHRICAAVEDILSILGPDRDMVICRELTKQFETTLRGTVARVLEQLNSDPNQRKGEFVLLLGPAEVQPELDLKQAVVLAQALAEDLPSSQAARIAARVTGVKRRAVYAAMGASAEGEAD